MNKDKRILELEAENAELRNKLKWTLVSDGLPKLLHRRSERTVSVEVLYRPEGFSKKPTSHALSIYWHDAFERKNFWEWPGTDRLKSFSDYGYEVVAWRYLDTPDLFSEEEKES
jgi:hypothetical protein